MSENTSRHDGGHDSGIDEPDHAAGRPRDERHDPSTVERAMAGIDVPDAELRSGEEGDDPAHADEEE